MRPILAVAPWSAAAFLGAVPAAAEEAPPTFDLAAGIALVSDYRFRGISLSDRRPSLQGSLVGTHRSGAYAGVSAYTLDGFGELGGSNLELDLYAGYRRKLGFVSADAGLLFYAYPGASGGKFEFFEPYASLSMPLGTATARLSAAFAPAQDALGGNGNLYLAADIAVPVRHTPFTLKARLGRSSGETPLTPGRRYGEWLAGADYAAGRVVLGVAVAGTDIGAADALAAGARRRDTRPTIVLSGTASF
ncbi:MAG TPA: TorF family putative porin [Allosphingosinicella sp.]|jgi:uncharacterized protein (TIGR02001 family)